MYIDPRVLVFCLKIMKRCAAQCNLLLIGILRWRIIHLPLEQRSALPASVQQVPSGGGTSDRAQLNLFYVQSQFKLMFHIRGFADILPVMCDLMFLLI